MFSILNAPIAVPEACAFFNRASGEANMGTP
jgi:hypothetical protein